MKVVYVLIATAWLVGAQTPGAYAQGDKKPAATPAAPAAPAVAAPVTVVGGDCGCYNSCDSGCGFLQRCRDFCSRLFSHNSCNTCNTCNTCNVAPTCCQPACRPVSCCPQQSCFSGCSLFSGWGHGCNSCNTCNSGCGGLFSGWGHSCFSGCNTGCNTCNTCNSGCGTWGHGLGCGNSCGCGFLDRCRSLFHRNDCCNTCNTCGTGTGAVIVPKGAETIPPPAGDPAKKMPGGGKTGSLEPPTPIQILNPANPLAPPVLETPPAPPAIGPAGLTPGRPF